MCVFVCVKGAGGCGEAAFGGDAHGARDRGAESQTDDGRGPREGAGGLQGESAAGHAFPLAAKLTVTSHVGGPRPRDAGGELLSISSSLLQVKELNHVLEAEKSCRTDLEMYVAVLNTQKSVLQEDAEKLRKELHEGTYGGRGRERERVSITFKVTVMNV